MRYYAAILALVLSACSAPGGVQPAAPGSTSTGSLAPHALTLTPLNAPTSVFPGAKTTELTGIRKNLITATVTLSNGTTIGGLYLRAQKKWMQIAFPSASSTAAYGPNAFPHGYRIVGSYKLGSSNDNGFVYDSITGKYTTLNAPDILCKPKKCNQTILHSSYGSGDRFYVVGNFNYVPTTTTADTSYPESGHALFYDSLTNAYLNIDVDNALSTTAYGIWKSGSALVVAGGFTDKTGRHAYVRDIDSKKFLQYDYPGAALTHFEGITGVGGAGNYNLVGDYSKPMQKAVYGFFLEVRNWQPGNVVVIGKLTANSVFDRDVVGVYNPGSGISGFTTTIPIIDPP